MPDVWTPSCPLAAAKSTMVFTRSGATALWSCLCVGLGYVFSSRATELLDAVGQASLWAVAAAAVMALTVWGLRRHPTPAERGAAAAR